MLFNGFSAHQAIQNGGMKMLFSKTTVRGRALDAVVAIPRFTPAVALVASFPLVAELRGPVQMNPGEKFSSESESG